MKRKQILSIENIEQQLWKTMQEVQNGKMDAGTASVIQHGSRELVRLASVEAKIATLSGRKPRKSWINQGDRNE